MISSDPRVCKPLGITMPQDTISCMASSTVRDVSRTFSGGKMTVHPVAGFGEVGTNTHRPIEPVASS